MGKKQISGRRKWKTTGEEREREEESFRGFERKCVFTLSFSWAHEEEETRKCLQFSPPSDLQTQNHVKFRSALYTLFHRPRCFSFEEEGGERYRLTHPFVFSRESDVR